MVLETLTVAVGPKATDRTAELTTAVLDVAVPTGATVVLLHVFSESAYQEGVEAAGYDPENPPPPHTVASRLESIDAMTATLEEAGVEYRIRGEVGSVTDSIIRATEEMDSDMLFISGRQRSQTGKVVFGSTAHKVMMSAACPVTFVREGISQAQYDAIEE